MVVGFENVKITQKHQKIKKVRDFLLNQFYFFLARDEEEIFSIFLYSFIGSIQRSV